MSYSDFFLKSIDYHPLKMCIPFQLAQNTCYLVICKYSKNCSTSESNFSLSPLHSLNSQKGQKQTAKEWLNFDYFVPNIQRRKKSFEFVFGAEQILLILIYCLSCLGLDTATIQVSSIFMLLELLRSIQKCVLPNPKLSN